MIEGNAVVHDCKRRLGVLPLERLHVVQLNLMLNVQALLRQHGFAGDQIGHQWTRLMHLRFSSEIGIRQRRGSRDQYRRLLLLRNTAGLLNWFVTLFFLVR